MKDGVRFKFYNLCLDSDSLYSQEYNNIKNLNQNLNVKQSLALKRYFFRLTFARLTKKEASTVKKPDSFATIPVIQSENARRPGFTRIVNQLLGFDVISFDIFDTCLLRNVYDPRDIFQIMGILMGFDNFKSCRIKAEQECRLKCYSNNGHDEILLDDIYEILFEEYQVERSWKEVEIELEKYFTVSNLYMKRIFDKLISAGKIVIFTSDMYLPKDVIESLLEKNGFTGYNKLFLSNEIKLSKKYGTLQEYISNQYGPDSRIIHIGDNYRYDIKNSKISNFETIYYRSVSELSKLYYNYNYSEISESIFKAIISNNLMNGTWKHSVYYETGFKIGGILTAGYCEYINDIVIRDNIDLILFCARDCDVIQKVYDRFYKKVDFEYVYVSRYALMNITPERYYLELYDRASSKIASVNGTIQDLLNSLELTYLSNRLVSSGFDITKTLNSDIISNLRLFISDNLSEIYKHNLDNIESARQYFVKKIGNHKRILIVDVGWTGSSANVLSYFIKHNISEEIYCKGSLLFGSANERLSMFSNGFIDCYISGPSKNRDLLSSQFELKRHQDRTNQIFEYIYSSIESSTVGYSFDENGFPTIIKSNRLCNNPAQIIDMQNGIIDFVDKFEKYSKKIRNCFKISPYVAYAPFKQIIDNESFISLVFSDFTYDAAIFQGKTTDNKTFGQTFSLKVKGAKKILLISHSFSYSGAPRSLLRMGKVIVSLGYYCEVWSPHDGGMRDEFINNGISVKIIKESELYLSSTVESIKEFDMAIANTILTYEYYMRIKTVIPCVWLIREASNIPDYCSKYHNYKMYYCLRHSKDIYCVSEYAAEFIKNYSKEVHILHNCVEDRMIKTPRPVGDKITFLQLGSLEPRKGYDILIKAFLNLPEHLSNSVQLKFAGQIVPKNIDYANSILSMIDKIPNIEYLGEIRNIDTISKLEHDADVIVVSSLDESCSLVALEATMMGRPLIVTKNVGAKYMVDSNNGIIVETNSVESLTNALSYMINNKDRLVEMGLSSREKYEIKANMRSHSKDISNLIQQYLIRRPSSFDKLFHKHFYHIALNSISAFNSLINEGFLESYKFLDGKYQLSSKLPDLDNRVNTMCRNKFLNSISKINQDHLVVSLTSYPKRIDSIHICIQSILNQSLKPDLVILYLADSQFPHKERDLPKSLLSLLDKGLTIKWCEDIKPHKKYYYAIQQYPDSIVVTCDDDIVYDKFMLSKLYLSYMQHPHCVSCLRAHRITFNSLGSLNKYSDWKWEDNSFLKNPSHSALATGCAGVLYPPHIFIDELFNVAAIKELSLMTDDLWLKIMELLSDVPVVLADKNERLHMIDGTQDSAISNLNIMNVNDANLSLLLNHYGYDLLINKIKKFD